MMRIDRWLSGMACVVAAACGTRAELEQEHERVCGGEAFPATFEAEDAQLKGVERASDGQGFTGSGYATEFTELGDEVTFEVCAPERGYYTVEFGYAKGTDGVATRTLLVDGKKHPGRPTFPPLWTWNTWGSGGRRSIHLGAGNHTIGVSYQQEDSGEVRLDGMTLSRGPTPSHVSVRSLLMNNWKDLVVGWHAAKLYPKDDMNHGPRMIAFHSAMDWPTNQIDEAQAFFRDETGGTSYTDSHQLDTTAFFTASDSQGYGELRVEYGDHGGKALPVRIVRRQVVPPGERFVVVHYDVTNVSDTSRRLSILEWADVHNKTAGPSEDPAQISPSPSGEVGSPGTMDATWDSQRNAWIVDMSRTNGVFLVIGAFDAVDKHVAGAPRTNGPDKDSETVKQFAGGASSLGDSGSFSGEDVGVGMAKTIALDRARSAAVSFFYGAASSLEDARALADAVRKPGAPGSWLERSSSQWKDWLSTGKIDSLEVPVPQWAQALRLALVTMRQSQQPEFGTFVAATNPAYHYKVWPRDSSVTAMGLDAAGYLDEAERYWTWMAHAQSDGSNPKIPEGAWWTNYSYFAEKHEIPFVDPEYDSIGLFLIGTYRHHEALRAVDSGRAARFLDTVWPAVQKAADFVQNELELPENHGFGPEDFSIWEEQLQFATFTQTTYASGLHAAQLLARERQDSSRVDAWQRARDTIRDAVFRDTSATPCPGEWDGSLQYFVRGVWPDCTLDRRVDAATDLVWVFGLLGAADPRTPKQREAILANLTPGEFGFGISRYEGDTFYESNKDSPGGPGEALGPMPVWPQMSMYMAMLEHWLGMDDLASDRLSWYVATTHAGFQPPGEAVDWTTELPLESTSSEPVTAAWYGLALLNKLGAFDPRLP